MARQGFGDRRQSRRSLAVELAPISGRALIGRRRQIVAQRRAQRGLIAGRDGDPVDDRRPEV